MPQPVTRGRYAPSPTGRLHLGNARTALLAWLCTRVRGGVFVMRVEDLDGGRSRPALEAAMLADLRWLGLDWDEGPDVGGSAGPYRQSERGDHYAAALARISTYPCICTRKELREVTHAPHGCEPVYPGVCRDRPTNALRPASLRWRVPPGRVEVVDRWAGVVGQSLETDVGDFVLRRADGAFAYQLAVVVDDAAMGITEVVRGCDLLTSAPRQVALATALGFAVPRFAHAPLLLGPTGEKLNKRDGAPDLTTLREAGADAASIVAWLAQSLGLIEAHIDRISAAELAATIAPDFVLGPETADLRDPRLRT